MEQDQTNLTIFDAIAAEIDPVCPNCNGERVIDRGDFLQKCICKKEEWNDRTEDQ